MPTFADRPSPYPLATDIASDSSTRPAHCVEGLSPTAQGAGPVLEETTEEVIGNLALLPVAREDMWRHYAAALETGDRDEQRKWLYAWNRCGTRISVMQLDITDRMLDEKRHRVDTGLVQAILEYDTSLRGRYVAVLYRDGEKVA